MFHDIMDKIAAVVFSASVAYGAAALSVALYHMQGVW